RLDDTPALRLGAADVAAHRARVGQEPGRLRKRLRAIRLLEVCDRAIGLVSAERDAAAGDESGRIVPYPRERFGEHGIGAGVGALVPEDLRRLDERPRSGLGIAMVPAFEGRSDEALRSVAVAGEPAEIRGARVRRRAGLRVRAPLRGRGRVVEPAEL